MKKLFTILLSLVLVFCFISCDQPSNSPKDEPSNVPPIDVPSIEEDPNAPDSSKFVKLEEDDASMILSVFYTFRSIPEESRNIISAYCFDKEYSFKEGAEIDGTSVSGSLSVIEKSSYDNNKEEDSNTYNGTIKIGEDEYILSDVVYSYKKEEGKDPKKTITGRFTKNGESFDIESVEAEDEPILFKLITDEALSDNSKCKDVAVMSGTKYEVAENNVTGVFSTEMSLSDGLINGKSIINLEKVKVGEKEHRLTAKLTITGTPESEDPTINVDYLSLDGKYYTLESVMKSDVFKALSSFIGA